MINTKFHWYQKVNVLSGFYMIKGVIILETRKRWFCEREYRLEAFVTRKELWIKESNLEAVNGE